MDRISLNERNADIRAQEIRLNVLDMAVRAAPGMGRVDGPLGVAKEFEAWILDAGTKAKPAAASVATVTTQERAAEPEAAGEATDMIDVKEEPAAPAAAPVVPASVRQAAKK